MSVKVSRQVWKVTRQSGLPLLVLLCLADHCDDDGVCWPSESTIATACRSSLSGVKKAIKLLLSEGDIKHKRRGGTFKNGKYTHSVYHLVRYSSSTHSKPLEASSGVNEDSGAVPVVTPNHQGRESSDAEAEEHLRCLACDDEIEMGFICTPCREKGITPSKAINMTRTN